MAFNSTNTGRCTSCVLPQSAKHVHFDSEGVCHICSSKTSLPKVQKSASGLAEQIERIKERGIGKPFDCIMGLSGGRDSSYLLYLLVKQHNLRCLAAYYRTPFTSDVIDGNVRRLVRELGVPLVELDISPELHRKFAAEIVRLWINRPNPILSNLACAPCKLVNREIYRIAEARGIQSIVYGGNIFEAIHIAPWQPSPARSVGKGAAVRFSLGVQLRKLVSIARTGMNLMISYPELWRHAPIGFKSSIMYMSLHTPFLKFRYPGMYALEYFYHAEWSEAACEKVLSEIGWQLPPGCRSSWRADCSFAEVKNYMLRETQGITYLDAFLANMVRAGGLTRDEALRRIESQGRISWERFKDACKAMDLPENSFASLHMARHSEI